jgi:hypothetical protein
MSVVHPFRSMSLLITYDASSMPCGGGGGVVSPAFAALRREHALSCSVRCTLVPDDATLTKVVVVKSRVPRDLALIMSAYASNDFEHSWVKMEKEMGAFIRKSILAYQLAKARVWSSPGLLVGNAWPRWVDSSNSNARRGLERRIMPYISMFP